MSQIHFCCVYLLSQLGIDDNQVHTIHPRLGPDAAALAYQQELIIALGDEASIDVLLLGIGPDGHTCSLFPRHVVLEERDLLVAAITDSPKPPPERITLTFKAIASARDAAFVTAGEGKAEVLKRILKDHDTTLPAALVNTRAGPPMWFIDQAAASKL